METTIIPNTNFCILELSDKTMAIEVNKHFFEKATFFKNLLEFNFNQQCSIKAENFSHLNNKECARNKFIASLNKEYTIENYFNFFKEISIDNLYIIYSWYNFIEYPDIETIICAATVQKAYKDNIFKAESCITFNQCTDCQYHNPKSFNFTISPDQRQPFLESIINLIFNDQNKDLEYNETTKNFINCTERILFNFYNNQYNEDGLSDFLCSHNKTQANEKRLPVNNSTPFETGFYNKLQNLLIPCKYIVCFSNMKFNVNTYFNMKQFLEGLPGNRIDKVIFHNVQFIDCASKQFHFFNRLQDGVINKATKIDIYLTGENTTFIPAKTGQNIKRCCIEFLYVLFTNSTSSWEKLLNETPSNERLKTTLFVSCKNITQILRKISGQAKKNMPYHAAIYLLKKSLGKTLSYVIICSILTSSVADLTCSLGYNIFFAHLYKLPHFLIPITLLTTTAVCTLKYTNTLSNNNKLTHEQERAKHFWKLNGYACIILILLFYIYEEKQYKPSGFHTYSLFPLAMPVIMVGFWYTFYKDSHVKAVTQYEAIKDANIQLIDDENTILN